MWEFNQGEDKGEYIKKIAERKEELQDCLEKEIVGNKKGDLYDELLPEEEMSEKWWVHVLW